MAWVHISQSVRCTVYPHTQACIGKLAYLLANLTNYNSCSLAIDETSNSFTTLSARLDTVLHVG